MGKENIEEGEIVKEYLIVYMDDDKVKNYLVEAINKKQALKEMQFYYEGIVINIIELGDVNE